MSAALGFGSLAPGSWLLAVGSWPLATGNCKLPSPIFQLFGLWTFDFPTFDFEVINRSATYDPMCLRRVKRNHLRRLGNSMK